MGRAAVLVWWYHIEVSIVEVSDSAFFFLGPHVTHKCDQNQRYLQCNAR